EDYQISIYVPVYQGDNKKASMNTKLGELAIQNITPEPKGTHEFEITFALDADGIFYGTVKNLRTGETDSIKLDRGKGAMTEKKRIDLAEMVEKGMVQDTTPSGSQHDVEQLISQAQSVMNNLPVSKRQELEAALTQLREARASNNHRELTSAIVRITML